MRRRNKGLLAIAIFKWCKALILIAVGVGILKLLHRDVGEVVENAVRSVRVYPDNGFLASLLAKMYLVDDKEIATFSGLSFGYSALFLVEGTGLYFEQRWAEYLTIVATASLIPVEIYQLLAHPTAVKTVILLLNIGILVFLIRIVWTERRRKPA